MPPPPSIQLPRPSLDALDGLAARATDPAELARILEVHDALVLNPRAVHGLSLRRFDAMLPTREAYQCTLTRRSTTAAKAAHGYEVLFSAGWPSVRCVQRLFRAVDNRAHAMVTRNAVATMIWMVMMGHWADAGHLAPHNVALGPARRALLSDAWWARGKGGGYDDEDDNDDDDVSTKRPSYIALAEYLGGPGARSVPVHAAVRAVVTTLVTCLRQFPVWAARMDREGHEHSAWTELRSALSAEPVPAPGDALFSARMFSQTRIGQAIAAHQRAHNPVRWAELCTTAPLRRRSTAAGARGAALWVATAASVAASSETAPVPAPPPLSPAQPSLALNELVAFVTVNLPAACSLAGSLLVTSRTHDPLYDCASVVYAGMCLAAVMQEKVHLDAWTADAIYDLVQAGMSHRGDYNTQLSMLDRASPAAARVFRRVAALVRGMDQFYLYSLPLSTTLQQAEKLEERYGVVLSERETWLILCTRCHAPHSVVEPAAPEGRFIGFTNGKTKETDGYRKVACRSVSWSLACHARKGTSPGVMFPVPLLGCIAIAANGNAYTICTGCGARTHVAVSTRGYWHTKCYGCSPRVSHAADPKPKKKRTR